MPYFLRKYKEPQQTDECEKVVDFAGEAASKLLYQRVVHSTLSSASSTTSSSSCSSSSCSAFNSDSLSSSPSPSPSPLLSCHSDQPDSPNRETIVHLCFDEEDEACYAGVDDLGLGGGVGAGGCCFGSNEDETIVNQDSQDKSNSSNHTFTAKKTPELDELESFSSARSRHCQHLTSSVKSSRYVRLGPARALSLDSSDDEDDDDFMLSDSDSTAYRQKLPTSEPASHADTCIKRSTTSQAKASNTLLVDPPTTTHTRRDIASESSEIAAAAAAATAASTVVSSSTVSASGSSRSTSRIKASTSSTSQATATGGPKPKLAKASETSTAQPPSCSSLLNAARSAIMKVELAQQQQQSTQPNSVRAPQSTAAANITNSARSVRSVKASSKTSTVQTRAYVASYKKSATAVAASNLVQTSTPSLLKPSSLIGKHAPASLTKSASAVARSVAHAKAASEASLATPSSSRINKKIKIATPPSTRNLRRAEPALKGNGTSHDESTSDDLNGVDSDMDAEARGKMEVVVAARRFETRLKTTTESCSTAMSSLTKHTKSSLYRVAFVAQALEAKNSAAKPSGPSTRKANGQSTGRTPPLKKFRKLRLFDEPRTPKTLLKESSKAASKMTDSATMTVDLELEKESSESPATPKAAAVKTPVSCRTLPRPTPVFTTKEESSAEDDPMFSSPPNEQKLKNSKIMNELLSSVSRTPKSSRRMRGPMSPFHARPSSNLLEMSSRKSKYMTASMQQFSSCNVFSGDDSEAAMGSCVGFAACSDNEAKMDIDDSKRSSSVGNLFLMAEKKKRLECNFGSQLPPQSPALSTSSKRLSSSMSSSRFREPFQVPVQPASSGHLRMRLFDHNGNSPTWNNMNKMLVFDDAPSAAPVTKSSAATSDEDFEIASSLRGKNGGYGLNDDEMRSLFETGSAAGSVTNLAHSSQNQLNSFQPIHRFINQQQQHQHHLLQHQRNLTNSIMSSTNSSLSSSLSSSVSSTSSTGGFFLNVGVSSTAPPSVISASRSSPISPFAQYNNTMQLHANINPFTPTNRYENPAIKNSLILNSSASNAAAIVKKAALAAMNAEQHASATPLGIAGRGIIHPTGGNNFARQLNTLEKESARPSASLKRCFNDDGAEPVVANDANMLSVNATNGGGGQRSNTSGLFNLTTEDDKTYVAANGNASVEAEHQTSLNSSTGGGCHNGSSCVPKNKRLALRQCLVSRYHEEFHEVCKLGSGEFGDVFKCINRLDGCTYAIKRSKKPIAGSALEVSAWKEVCAHAVLVKHNHIVQYYSAWAEADRMLIQNEYCNGGSLAEFIECLRQQNSCLSGGDADAMLRMDGSATALRPELHQSSLLMSEADLKILLLHVAKGLAYMHSLNLVHLDIKPGNIFMCRSPKRVHHQLSLPTEMNAFGKASAGGSGEIVVVNEESGIESEEIEEDEIINSCAGAEAARKASSSSLSARSMFSDSITYKIGDLGHVTSTLDPHVEEGDCRYLPNEILQEQYDHLPKADVFALALTVCVCASLEELPKNGEEWHAIRRGQLKEMKQCSERFKKLLTQMVSEEPTQRPSATTLVNHPCICPDAHKSKAQLRKELNQEKFKNEMLKQKVKIYEEQMVSNSSPKPFLILPASSAATATVAVASTGTTQQQRIEVVQTSSKLARSRSSTFL